MVRNKPENDLSIALSASDEPRPQYDSGVNLSTVVRECWERELRVDDQAAGRVETCAAYRLWEVRYWREGHTLPLCRRCRACLALIGSVLNDEGDVEHVLATVTS